MHPESHRLRVVLRLPLEEKLHRASVSGENNAQIFPKMAIAVMANENGLRRPTALAYYFALP